METDAVKNAHIKHIVQTDNSTFSIEWTDGARDDYRLADLQEKCPCAGCRDDGSGLRRRNAPLVEASVCAKKIASVGRYAIRIEFTSGCSHGIYSFDLLRGSKIP